jgi:anti-sigma B factor antagonist
METNLEKIGDVSVLELLEEYLDASNSTDLKDQISSAATANAKLLLDLGRVEFIDSSGCGAIIGSLRKVHSVGGELKLCNLTKQVRALFELVRMHKILDIFDTRDEALASYKK